MKKRKLLFLLTAVLALSVPLSACDEGDSSSSSVQEKEPHAMATHFALSGDTRTAYSTVTRYEGKLESVNKEHGLAVLRKTEYTKLDDVKETVTVLDMASGNKLWSDYVQNPSEESHKDTLSVNVENYPFIEIKKGTWVEGEYGLEKKTTYTYRFANESCTALVLDAESEMDYTSLGSMYVCEIDDMVYWISENMEVLRTFNKLQTNGYRLPDFNASYNDYLYAWNFSVESRVIEVYNREGICSMQYTHPSDVGMVGYNQSGPVVLNDGNILVQELVLSEVDSTDYDFKILQAGEQPWTFDEVKVDMTTKIINYKTGDVKEIDVDYVIMGFEAAYAKGEYGYFPFELQEGEENQAYIAKIVNQDLSSVEYVTMNNNGEITYTVQNEWLQTSVLQSLYMGAGYSQMGMVDEEHYIAMIPASIALQNGPAYETWMFDLDGNKVAKLPNVYDYRYTTEDYIITEYGIYDYTGALVYDFENSSLFTESGPISGVNSLLVTTEGLVLPHMNLETLQYEVYKFDGKDFVKVEWPSDGKMEMEIPMEFFNSNASLPKGNKMTITYTSNDMREMMSNNSFTWTLYNAEGEAFLKMQRDSISSDFINVLDEAAYIETEIDGKDYLYVIK